MNKFDYESSYKKVMDESLNNIRKMDRMALQQMANKMSKEINSKITEVKTNGNNNIC